MKINYVEKNGIVFDVEVYDVPTDADLMAVADFAADHISADETLTLLSVEVTGTSALVKWSY